MQQVNVGVVGAGYLGKFHAQKYAAMPGVCLTGVVDIDPDCAESVAQDCSTAAYGQYQDLFGKVDAVSIVVPTYLHYSISREFLSRGVHVMIEKPMTQTLAEADSLIEMAEKNGCILQVGHLERFNPAVLMLDSIIDEPVFIESHRLSFYKERGIDVSVVHDLMIHDIDIICHFVKSAVKQIHASGVPVITPHVDIANARLEFENGCVANITASRISLKNERKIRFFQKNAYISADFADRSFTVIKRNEQAVDSPIPGMEIKQNTCQPQDALQAELDSFVDAVKHQRQPVVTGGMGRNALAIALQVVGQIEDGHKRHFESLNSGHPLK